MVIIAAASTILPGCSDSNHPTFITGDSGSVTGFVHHGDIQVDGVIGYVTLADEINGVIIQAPVYAGDTTDSFYQVSVPQGRYTATITDGSLSAIWGLGAEVGATVTFTVESPTFTVLEGMDVQGPVVGVKYEAP